MCSVKEKIEMAYLSLDNEAFQRKISLRECYELMNEFLIQYNARGERNTVSLLSDIGVGPNGQSCDPAQLYDFAQVAGKFLNDRELEELSNNA